MGSAPAARCPRRDPGLVDRRHVVEPSGMVGDVADEVAAIPTRGLGLGVSGGRRDDVAEEFGAAEHRLMTASDVGNHDVVEAE